jgi:uncharacterized Zn-binding protein involved in type VI secretion
MARYVARVESDQAESPFVDGATSVLVNGQPMVLQGSTTAHGNTVVTSQSKVLAEGRPVARSGDATAWGPMVQSGSDEVCLGDL